MKPNFNLAQLTIEDIKKTKELMDKYDTHPSEPLFMAVEVILQNKGIIIRKEVEWEGEPWSVGVHDFSVETFDSKSEAIAFCEKFNLNYEFWDE